MNILFLSYWPLNDPLTITTVIPHIEILNRFPEVNKVVLATPENGTFDLQPLRSLKGTIHLPLKQIAGNIPVLSHWFNHRQMLGQLQTTIREHRIRLVIARGAMAGSLAYKLWQRTQTPFVVESFEPHADYMFECGVWGRFDPRYMLQKHWEKMQHRHSDFLIPCAHSYKTHLVATGVPESKIKVIPCCIPLDKFAYNPADRKSVRNKLNIPETAVVGIYLGKFGGVYYRNESFQIFNEAFRHFGNAYHQLILTPEPAESLAPLVKQHALPENQVHIHYAQNHEVPAHLSAADFAYSPIVYSPSQLFRSLVKNGEYWASGLPILQTEGVGDDAAILETENAGACFRIEKWETVKNGLAVITSILSEPDHRQRISQIAARERNFIIAETVYQQLISHYSL